MHEPPNPFLKKSRWLGARDTGKTLEHPHDLKQGKREEKTMGP